jgi:hypothetical protein
VKFGSDWEMSGIAENSSRSPQVRGNQTLPGKPRVKRRAGRVLALAICMLAMLRASSSAQDALPFEVSNPKHLKWQTEEAGRIYVSACELVARSIRPEKPPRLQPRFKLVLGAREDEMRRRGAISEVRLKVWDAARFAEAMVLMAAREILKDDDLTHLTRATLVTAQATVSVNELKRNK